ncbi:glycoside hydrolase family 2 TIM barrel-domain containing protein [Coraliomargarita sp. SDUM461004]|uniref:Beta-mannosidase B n=1 Tax=Thalassobacterium sedimentorum TaxID=3041258 RepID=A0ABU1ADW8_9BACT|nr:glycoside hydrolase family 2 protein [Coraliomargarita sp. SDUM461004]MDQ8192935.1 glycoside hydrolase family 2 TIM barrel-domain containing protein [Coraliomargarita sp. SDUM461004]
MNFAGTDTQSISSSQSTVPKLHQTLNGEWNYHSKGDNKISGKATVPGCIHTDLLREGKIDAPYFRDNEAKLFWIGEENWIYEKEFKVEEHILAQPIHSLHCKGLDTLAQLNLNGHTIGQTDNMYRHWSFDVTQYLKPGKNLLRIEFQAATPWLRERKESSKVALQKVGSYEALPRAELRKEPCNFGWDWGPVLTTCGIWLPIYLEGHQGTKLQTAKIEQFHKNGQVELKVSPEFEGNKQTTGQTVVRLYRNDLLITESIQKTTEPHALTVKDPDLWWPAGMGEAALYQLQVQHKSPQDAVINTINYRIGLRTIRLITKDEANGQSFYFEVNGKPIFSKGSNWIPADSFPNNVSESKMRQLLEDAKAANMNMIRVWGGGYYEPNVFFDICDELGLMVWQDFMFCCSTYPTDNDAFMQNVAQELREQITRLRHHASLCLWCGNNELEMYHTGDRWDAMHMPWSEYAKLFDQLMPQLVKELNPECNYWPGSPHSPQGNRLDYNNPSCGDAHIWDVWFHDKESSYHLDCSHRYISEFGFSSFAHPTTINSFTDPEDRIIGSYVLGQHQRNRKGDGMILNHIFKRFKLPSSFEKIVWLSQITQGDIMREAIEHWRRLQPHTMGALYWQLNDCWPVTSWSTLDYKGRWKASHYMTRRYFAPLLLSVKKLGEGNAFEIWLTQDVESEISGQLEVKAWRTSGELLHTENLTLGPTLILSDAIARYQNSQFLKKASKQEVIIEVKFRMNEQVSTALHHFIPLKHVKLEKPEIQVEFDVQVAENKLQIKLQTNRPSPFTFVDLADQELRASDNFVHLFPNDTQVLNVALNNSRKSNDWLQKLTISNLYELCKSEVEHD